MTPTMHLGPPKASGFVPERLRMAREFHGWTIKELGERVATSFQMISHLENGRKEPGETLLEALADELVVEREYFYTPAPTDPVTQEKCHFRRRRSASKRLQSRARSHAQYMADLVDYLQDQLGLPPVNIPKFALTKGADVEDIARQCRLHWGIAENSPIRTVSRVFEHAGAVLFDTATFTDCRIDAFSVARDRPLILLNWEKGSSSREVWNAGHEIGHLVMHDGIVTGDKDTENQANAFAAAFLLPKRAFEREFPSRVEWPKIFAMKQRWRVSAAAIIVRGYHLGLLSAAEYRKAYKYIHYRRWHKGEPYEPDRERPELIATSLRVLKEEKGVAPIEVAKNLGWRLELFCSVTGLEIEDQRRLASVTEISKYKQGKRRSSN